MAIEVSRSHLDRFRGVIAKVFGLDFDENRIGYLDRVMRGRLERAGGDPAAYLDWLDTGLDAQELKAIVGQVTISETYFFRHMDQYRALAEAVIPDRLAARRTTPTVRLLSLGCASGEEAFSLAMVARETIDDSWTIAIRAVDVNPAMLERARAGRFSEWALRETPPRQRAQWFRASGAELVLDESIRAAVQFEERNVAADDPAWWQQQGTFDVVFCRNLLMYFTVPQAERLVRRIATVLSPGGYLFLGHAETLRGLSNDFHLCHTHQTFYYQRKEGLGVATGASEETRFVAAVPAVEPPASWVDAIRSASNRVAAVTSQFSATPALSSRVAAASDVSVAVDLLRQDRFGEALSHLNALPVDLAADADALLLRAVLLTHGGNLADAEAASRRLLEVDEMNAGAHYLLALCREGQGDVETARSHDQIAAYLDPGFAMPRLHQGLLARRAGARDDARREFGQALVLLQREDSARILLFGGGFNREALTALCRAELRSCGAPS